MSQPQAPALAPLVVDLESTYVSGFPANVAITVKAADPGAWFANLPIAETFKTYDAVGVELWGPSGGSIHKRLPVGFVDPQSPAPKFKLAPGDSRRMLFDLFDLTPPGLAPGAYGAVLLYGDLSQRTQSAKVSFAIRAPTAAEQKTLEALKPELTARATWGQWTMMPPPKRDGLTPPKDKADPLRYNRMIQYLLYGPQKLADIDPAALDVLDGLYAPEAAALKAELLAARDPAAFKAQALLVRQKYPGLSYWMSEIESRQSRFAWIRGNR